MQRGPVEEVVVPRREAVDQVEGETAEEGGQGVLRHPPHLVREERRGKCTGTKSSVVGADDGVEEDLFQPHIEIIIGTVPHSSVYLYKCVK